MLRFMTRFMNTGQRPFCRFTRGWMIADELHAAAGQNYGSSNTFHAAWKLMF